uniref:Biogenesis of lysosome-related organelles complex 1 subunit 5 n=1 Tax=Rhabditophanes sp. KR3021 TaxID=114890 RepID=A0AC35UDV5_9BILA
MLAHHDLDSGEVNELLGQVMDNERTLRALRDEVTDLRNVYFGVNRTYATYDKLIVAYEKKVADQLENQKKHLDKTCQNLDKEIDDVWHKIKESEEQVHKLENLVKERNPFFVDPKENKKFKRMKMDINDNV